MAEVADETMNQLSRIGELLKKQGYDVEEPQHGVMWVTIEYAYLISYSKDDTNFYQLMFPMGLEEKEKRGAEYLKAINTANTRSKLAKAYMDKDDDLAIVVDVIASGPEEFVTNFARYVSAIQTLLDQFDALVGG